ncbi:Ras Gtpase-Activating Protein 4B [Manis pentadactyla]|nr:Ras Gtpase-Activating Protein 4B [Manis pentadactyla]
MYQLGCIREVGEEDETRKDEEGRGDDVSGCEAVGDARNGDALGMLLMLTGQDDVSDGEGGKDEGSSHAPGGDTGSKDIGCVSLERPILNSVMLGKAAQALGDASWPDKNKTLP